MARLISDIINYRAKYIMRGKEGSFLMRKRQLIKRHNNPEYLDKLQNI